MHRLTMAPTARPRARALVPALLALLMTTLPGRAVGQTPADSAAHAAHCARVPFLITAPLASLLDESTRVAEITGCAPGRDRLIRRGGTIRPSSSDELAARLVPAHLHTVERSGYADDRNNGALWEGAGLSTSLRSGVQLSAWILSAALEPELLFQQNAEFATRASGRSGYSKYASPYYVGIDLPQRFGDTSWWDLGFGESYIRVDYGPAAAGLSSESLWRGPAVRYPILLSNSAGGFPHAFVGTNRPVYVWIGELSAELVWGSLDESEYFDEIESNDDTRLVNLSFVLDVRGLDGLALGITRSYHYRGEGFSPVLETIGLANTENRAGNELASIFGRWVLPESGAELYAEWARDDVIGEWPEFLQEPDHAQAYMLGFQKVHQLDRFALRVHGELVHLQEKGENRTDSRPIPVYYTHLEVPQGYTHRGQLLGTVGPGSDAQFLAVDALLGTAQVGVYAERVRRNDLTADAYQIRRWSPFEHDAEILGGIRGALLRDDFSFEADLRHAFRYNREFRENDRSWRAELRVGWAPALEWTR